MKRILLIIAIAILPFTGFSQDFKNAFGYRGGTSSGLTYQHFFNEEIGLKTILSWRSGGIQFIALVENYHPIMLKYTDKVFLYYGFGFHAGYARDNEIQYLYAGNQYGNDSRTVFGGDAIIGIEYRFITLPIVIGFDYKPFFELYGQSTFRFNVNDFALNLKFTF